MLRLTGDRWMFPATALVAMTLSLSLVAVLGLALAGGGAPALEALLLPVLGTAYAVARRLTGNDGDAEDLVQEAALRATRGFAGFAPGTNFRAWFLRILHNTFVSDYRASRRRGTPVELDDTDEAHLFRRASETGLLRQSPDPAGALVARLDAERIGDALAALPDEYREVCTLYFLADLTYDEIATSLGIPVGTVRSRLHRGRRALQAALWELATEAGIVRAHAEGDV